MALSAGDLVGGRYCLEEVIGSGGMGDVWRARDRVLERPVAVKLIYAGDPRKRAEHAKAFLREARISAAISHRNVVQILDFGAHDGDIPFMVLELLSGETVAHVLGRGDAVPFDWMFSVITQTLDGLAAAHDAGVIHRDLKPENIFLVQERDGVFPKILDFGISKVVDDENPSDSIGTTAGGRLLGTPAYMSPEQARGLKHLGKTTDVYSMGVVLYELISGSMPFYSENPGDLLLKIVSEQAPQLIEIVPDVGKALSDLVARAMSRRPEDRFADAREMQKALIAAAADVLGSEAALRLEQRVRPPSWRKLSTDPRALDGKTLARSGKRAKGDVATLDLRELSGAGPTPRSRRVWLAAGGALLMALAVAVAVSLSRTSAEPAPRFIVVRADDRPSTASQAPASRLDPEAKQPAEPQALTASKPAPVESDRPSGAGLAAQTLARSFRDQKSGVVRCVNQHAQDLLDAPKLAVRIGLDAEGHVQSAEVAPVELRTTAVGQCIEQAVRSMRFAPQGAPVSFQVPLTTRRGG